jgi:hypothetical protein
VDPRSHGSPHAHCSSASGVSGIWDGARFGRTHDVSADARARALAKSPACGPRRHAAPDVGALVERAICSARRGAEWPSEAGEGVQAEWVASVSVSALKLDA